jgi:hypothetical protein
MTGPRRLRVVVLALNTLGFAGYLYWLVARARHFMYAQEGVLYVLPCLLFVFVYLALYRIGRDA